MSGLKKSKIYAYYLLDSQESGIFYTWNECEQKVKGKKARYKSFKSEKEAQEWLKSGAEYEKKDMGRYAELILAVLPGITGIWQVSGRSDVAFETRAQMDVWYMKNWCIWNDIVIIIKTFKVVLLRKGAS